MITFSFRCFTITNFDRTANVLFLFLCSFFVSDVGDQDRMHLKSLYKFWSKKFQEALRFCFPIVFFVNVINK